MRAPAHEREVGRAATFGALLRESGRAGAMPSTLAWRREQVPLWVVPGFIVAYGLVAELSAQLARADGLSPWFPPVGLSLALVVAFGARAIPLVLVADMTQLLARGVGDDVVECFAQGAAQAIFWGTTGLLLRERLTVEPALSRLRDVLWFAAATTVGSAIAGFGGVALLTLLHDEAWTGFLESVRIYAIGDAIGILTVTPALLILAGLPARAPQAAAAFREAVGLGWEFWAMLAATIIVPAFAIHGPSDLVPFAPLPMAWVALRLGMPAASFGLLIWSIAAVVAFQLDGTEVGLLEISASMVSGGLLAIFAGAVVTERERGRARLAYLALHDEATGLPNRRSIEESVAAALRRDHRGVAVLLVRLTGLPEPGEGGPALEPVLLEAADRLRRLTGPESTIARIGSRRFVVLIEGPEAEQATVLADRLVEGLEPPVVLDGFEYLLGPVVGLAEGETADHAAGSVVDHAAAAARAAVTEGAPAASFAEVAPAMQDEADLARDLREALDRGELSLAFQPIASIRHGSVAGAEALLRWTHPQRGPIGPAEFIPIAEACGLILPIGRWVLRKACRAAATWPYDHDPLTVHVNISPVQLRDEGLVADVRDALAETGLPPTRLCLELTESGVFDDLDVAAKRILALGELGVRVVLDDFGTGHSSLQWLQRLPVAALKIDRSFVGGVDSRPVDLAIVQATLGLAQLLGLETVAEGVETERQLEVLREQGCTSIQGYLLLPPVAGPRFRSWLDEYIPMTEKPPETMF